MVIKRWQDWTQQDELHYLETPYGRAVVTEVHKSDAGRWIINPVSFVAQFEHPDGQITQLRPTHKIENLEMAKYLLMEYVQSLEKEGQNESELRKLIETLEVCRRSVQGETAHVSHLNRIEQILKEYFG